MSVHVRLMFVGIVPSSLPTGPLMHYFTPVSQHFDNNRVKNSYEMW